MTITPRFSEILRKMKSYGVVILSKKNTFAYATTQKESIDLEDDVTNIKVV